MPKKPLFLLASPGGHLTELLEISEAFKGRKVHYLTYAGVTSDHLPDAHFFPNLAQRPWRIFDVTLRLFLLLLKHKPACLISTGGELSIPAFLLGKILFRTRLIFIECSAQVQTPSFTGRIVYPFCDLFLVQWQTLLSRYGRKARYAGGLI